MSNEIFQKPAGRLESVSKEVGFDVPVESVSLPSKGLVYPVDSQLAGLEELQIKCMTAKEEDLLTSRALIKSGGVLAALLRACLINKAIDPDEMLTGDRNALLISIRITGYGSDYEASLQCGECDKKFDNTFSLSHLKLKRLGALPVEPNKNIFAFKLPLSNLDVTFKLLTGKDENAISSEIDSLKKVSPQIENNVTVRLSHAIISIGGETDPAKVRKMISNLRAGDAKALRNYMDKIEPGVDMTQSVKCPHCSAEQEVDIPIGMGFFWPDLAK